MTPPIRVLIVDDSAMVRRMLSEGLAQDPQIEVVGVAHDAYAARDKIVQLKPDVLTLDIDMPRMDGVAFLQRLMPQYPLPVIMVSALSDAGQERALQALEAGALDFVAKPTGSDGNDLHALMRELRTKIKIASTANLSHWRQAGAAVPRAAGPTQPPGETNRIIAIGASTGGTEAIRTVLAGLPHDSPGIVIAQHMPAGFTRKFAERLNNLSPMQVKEAEHGDCLRPGLALVAPGERQLRIVRCGTTFQADVRDEGLIGGHSPSIDVLLHSLAQQARERVVAAILTGMGRDGAQGLAAVREAGGRTLAQDEASCIVFGMPREAWRSGAAEALVPLDGIAAAILQLVGGITT